MSQYFLKVLNLPNINIKHEYLRSRAYICLSLSSSLDTCSILVKFDHYRDTRAAILDPSIQGILEENKL